MNQLPEDDILRQFWLESKKEAPLGFSDAIMQNLPEASPLPDALKKPLLSLKAALILGALVVALITRLSTLQVSSESAAPWYQALQHGLNSSLGWLGANSAVLPTLAMLSAAIVVLMGLDRLLKRFLHRTPQAH
jgi:hypothetical protein